MHYPGMILRAPATCPPEARPAVQRLVQNVEKGGPMRRFTPPPEPRSVEAVDELTAHREVRRADAEAWFMTEWDRLDPEDRRAIAALVTELHDNGLRRRPAAVAFLRSRGC